MVLPLGPSGFLPCVLVSTPGSLCSPLLWCHPAASSHLVSLDSWRLLLSTGGPQGPLCRPGSSLQTVSASIRGLTVDSHLSGIRPSLLTPSFLRTMVSCILSDFFFLFFTCFRQEVKPPPCTSFWPQWKSKSLYFTLFAHFQYHLSEPVPSVHSHSF